MTLSTNVARSLSYLDSNILILNLVHEFYRNLSVLAAVPHLKSISSPSEKQARRLDTFSLNKVRVGVEKRDC